MTAAPQWAEVYEALKAHGWKRDTRYWGTNTDSGRTAPERLYRRGNEELYLKTGRTPPRVTWGRYVRHGIPGDPGERRTLPRASTTATALEIVTAAPKTPHRGADEGRGVAARPVDFLPHA